MRSVPKMLAAIAASTALLASSTAVAAAGSVAPAQPAASSSWMTLAGLSPGSSAAVAGCGAAAAAGAAQGATGCVFPVGALATPAVAPPPAPLPPPPPPPAFALGGELLGMLVWLPLIAIALGTSGASGRPNSPA